MIRWLRGLFSQKTKPICGGQGRCDVVDGLGRVVAKIWFARPDSDLQLEYVYAMQESLSNQKEILKFSKSSGGVKEFHKDVYLNKTIPFAKKIFIKSEGYKTDTGEDVGLLESDEQFNHIRDFHIHHLADVVSVAFSNVYAVKKN